MGKLEGGAFGPVSGKVGRLVSYNLNGQNVIRKNRVKESPANKPQLASRQRMKMVNVFLKPIKGFINLGYLFAAHRTIWNQYNLATSNILLNAMSGEFPNIRIDYSKVLVSKGDLKTAVSPNAILNEGSLSVNWIYDEAKDYDNRNDRAMILIYFNDEIDPIFILSGSLRSEQIQLIKFDHQLNTIPLNIYLSFFAEDRMSVSDSTYLYAE
jgi:hypothetical protein